MFTMLTAPTLTLLFLGIIVGSGIAFVRMLYEIKQLSKPHRNRDRFGRHPYFKVVREEL
jgi:hypothetical protein